MKEPELTPDQALLAAAMGNDSEGIQRALDLGADPNARDVNGMTALHYVARGGDDELSGKIKLTSRSMRNIANIAVEAALKHKH
ncbi:MAG: ankyrin repeat domain-containing protein [Gammaproteobacteria bacterium AqS3]|nr:ankyrin repeat domain-containing protein [Gammaproteobacteria bacterium AqS3]